MATQAISDSDLSKIRNSNHQLTAVRINAVRPEIVATYSISGGSQSVITDLSGSLSSGTVSDVLLGRRVALTDGTYTQYSTVRKTSDASNLYINALGEGQGGYANKISPAQSALTTAYVYNDFPLYGEYSRVVSKTVPILPRWDLAYSNQTSSAIPPIANTGAHQSKSVAYGATASFTLPRLGSNTSFAFGGETISSYSWSLPTGATFKAGYSATDAAIEVDAVAGQHLIKLTATDSNSQAHTAYVWLFVDDGITYKTLNDEFQARIVSDNRNENGRTVELELKGQVAESAILPATMIHLQTDQTYGGLTLTEGVIVDTFVGYVQQINSSYDGNIYTTRLTVVSPYIYLQSVATAPQVIFEDASPANWTEVTSALSNPRGALSYLRWQCQNLFALHDIDCPYTEPRKKDYQFAGSTVASHLNVIAETIAGNVGSASDGTLVVRKNPVFRDNTFRNALAVGCTFGASDIVGQLDYNEPIHTVFQDVRSGAFAYNGSTTNAWYGVKRWEQGGGRTESPYFSVTASEGRDTVLEMVGHMAKDANYPVTIDANLSRDFEVIDPVYMIWYQLNVDSSFDSRGRGWNNVRILPKSVNTAWDLNQFTRTPTVTFKEETFGQPAEEYFLSNGDLSISNGWLISQSVPYLPQSNQFGLLTAVGVLLNTTGQLAVTQTLINANPTYIDLSNYVTGNVNDVCYDYNSAFFTSGYLLTEQLSLYIVSSNSTTLYIYRLDDIKAQSFTVTELASYTMADASNTTNARIACSRGTPTLVVMAWHDQTGIEFGRSTNGGGTWSSKANVGSATTDTNNDNASIGLYVSDANQVVTGFDGTDYGTYLATTAGGSFSQLANSEDNTAPNPMIAGDGDTTLYVATKNNGVGGGADYTVDFDGGYSSYTVVNPAGATDTGTGNPDNGLEYGVASTSPTTSTTLQLSITDTTIATSSQTIDIDLDVYYDWNAVARPFASTTTLKMQVRATFNASGTPQGSTAWTVLEQTGATSNGVTFSLTYNDTWQSTSLTQTMPSGTIDTIVIEVQALAGQFEVTSQSYLRADNIEIYIDGGSTPISPALYKVTTYTATDSWTDVTPDTDYIPLLPHGLILDKLDTDNIEAFADDASTPKWFSSDDIAVSWDDNGASDYRTGIKVGNSMLLGGVSAFDITADNGTTVTDKLGNLGLVWGSVGTIKKILVVTE